MHLYKHISPHADDTSGTEFCQHDIQLKSSTRNAPQNVTVPADIDDQEILDYSIASEVLPILPPYIV